MKLDQKKTALLTLDLQNGIFGFVPAAGAVVANAAKAVDFARKKRFLIIHVGLGFAPGHSELPDTESRWKRLKDNNLFVIGTGSAPWRTPKISSSISSESARFRRTSST